MAKSSPTIKAITSLIETTYRLKSSNANPEAVKKLEAGIKRLIEESRHFLSPQKLDELRKASQKALAPLGEDVFSSSFYKN